MHPSTAEALADLDFRHLPEHLRGVSMRFAALGAELAAVGGGAKITRALHHLRAAKDLAVQAAAAPGRDDHEVVGAMLAALAEQADKLDADPTLNTY